MTKTSKQVLDFMGLGISPSILDQLQKLNFNTPTPIQHQAIPIAIAGQDLMGIAQTGTGKTLAFGIPMIQRLFKNKSTGLILLPTRELAAQVDQDLKTLGSRFGLRTAILIGGTAIGPQTKALASQPHIIIATPGRLMDHLEKRKNILNNVEILVLDEADRMLDMGFEPDIKKILASVKTNQRQTMLFSATMPIKITNLAQKYMRSPLRVEVAPAGSTVKSISQEAFIVERSQKLSLLDELLTEYKKRVLVFSRTKHGAKKITRVLKTMGHAAAEIHSNKSLTQRTKALKDFKSGAIRVLVATDIASRGIDVKDIEVVINYDLPDQSEDYVHRIGRTGRAGKRGKAISFVAPDQKRDLLTIERLVRIKLPIKPLPVLKPRAVVPKQAPYKKYSNNRPIKPKVKPKRRRPFNRRRRRKK
ncbi:DEAD/DEAH box helicase [bacterium]|nr:DEAD/DEAH box helicase [bacterium]